MRLAGTGPGLSAAGTLRVSPRSTEAEISLACAALFTVRRAKNNHRSHCMDMGLNDGSGGRVRPKHGFFALALLASTATACAANTEVPGAEQPGPPQIGGAGMGSMMMQMQPPMLGTAGSAAPTTGN